MDTPPAPPPRPPTATPVLPFEIMNRIINHVDDTCLYQLLLVNRLFHSIITPRLWKAVHLPPPATTVQHQQQPFDASISFFYTLVTSPRSVGHYIRTIHLGVEINDGYLLLLMKYAPHIEHVILEQAQRITDASVQYIADYWRNISSLQLTDSPISQISYDVLGMKCPRLAEISLLQCSNVRPDTFSTSFAANSPLEALTIDIFVPMTMAADDDDDDDDDLWLTNVCDLRNLRSIKQLEIHGLPYGIFVPATRLPFCWFPHLTTLYLDECFEMGNEQVIPMLDACGPCLLNLALVDAVFTDLTLTTAIARRKRQLRSLTISYNTHITARGVRAVIHSCSDLTMLRAAFCDLRMAHFPEASAQHSGRVAMANGPTVIRLDHLDSQVLNMVRQAPF